MHRLKNDFFFFFLSRLEPHPPSAEPHQHPALHPEPEGDRQPAQTHTAVENDRVLGLHPASVPRLCKTIARIRKTEERTVAGRTKTSTPV